MSNEEKIICFIYFLGKKGDWESWSEQKGYKKLWVSSRSMSGIDEIPTQDEYENALEDDMDLDKKIIKLAELNDLAHEVLILFFNTTSSVVKADLDWWGMQRIQIFPSETARLHRIDSKYASHTAMSFLKLEQVPK